MGLLICFTNPLLSEQKPCTEDFCLLLLIQPWYSAERLGHLTLTGRRSTRPRPSVLGVQLAPTHLFSGHSITFLLWGDPGLDYLHMHSPESKKDSKLTCDPTKPRRWNSGILV